MSDKIIRFEVRNNMHNLPSRPGGFIRVILGNALTPLRILLYIAVNL